MRRNRKRRGVALLLAVMLLALLIVLVGAMVLSSGSAQLAAENSVADLQNTLALRSAYYRALLYLQADLDQGAGVDTLHERWAEPFSFTIGDTTVDVKIQDEDRRLNLSKLVASAGGASAEAQAIAARLFSALGQEASLADRVLDYEDPDNTGQYEQGARNAFLYNVDELARIREFPAEALYGGEKPDPNKTPLYDFVTVAPGQGSTYAAQGGGTPVDLKVNVNTAPAQVLAALSDKMTPEIAAGIVSYREGVDDQGKPRAITSTAELSSVQGMTPEILQSLTPYLAFTSATFSIRAEATTGAMKKAWVYVVKRGGPNGAELLAQYRDSRYQQLKPPQ